MLLRRYLSYYLIFCCSLFVMIIVTYIKCYILDRTVIHFVKSNTASCHNTDNMNALPAIKKTFDPSSAIFFHETSCRGGLNSRQACAVEAAARKHPNKSIYLLFNSPVSETSLSTSYLAKLRSFKNVNIYRINLQEYAKGTPLESYIDDLLEKSEWPVEHISDVMRILTLYKWNGIYLDLDMLVTRPLTNLSSDWIARDSGLAIGTGVVAVSKSGIGRAFINAVMRYVSFFPMQSDREIQSNIQRNSRVYNGRRIINKVLRKLCHHQPLSLDWSEQNCSGFLVYPPDLFYPLHYSYRNWYFQAANMILEAPTGRFNSAFTHHLWNGLTGHYSVDENSYYAYLAKTHCPTIYHMQGQRFGS